MRLLACLTIAATAFAQEDEALARLTREVERVARLSGAVVGVAATHIETGRSVTLRPTERFPMASTVKIPLALEVLTRVDQGKESLDRMITVEPRDLHPGSGTLTDLFNKPGVSLSVRNLLELMLLISDNSATDILLRSVGGGEAVTARMRASGIDGLRVDRPTAWLIADASGLKLPRESEWSPQVFASAFEATTAESRAESARRFRDDPRDTSTPEAMARLLVRVHNRELLKPDSAELLVDILRRCRTGQARLKGVLPAGTEVVHKTGSMPGVVNDVGVVTLPDGAGHVALAVFVKNGEEPEKMERAIADVARAAHDFFLFHPKGAVDYPRLAETMVSALKPERGERYFLRPDSSGYFEALAAPLRKRLMEAGAVETRVLDEAQIYLWMPLRPGGAGLPAAEREAVKRWTDGGGSRRQLHFHWGEGSVFADGLYGEHSAALDALYQRALEVDRGALSATQDRVIALLRSGVVRVRTPAGTDIRFRTGDRPFNRQDGDASPERMKRAVVRIDRDIELPAGAIRVAPIEESVNGVVVIPEARFVGQTVRGIKLHFKNGSLTRAEAAENGGALEKALREGGDAARRFREFALGLHPMLKPAPAAKVVPYYGYGEGVVRLSLGDNEELGGKVRGGFVRWFFFPDAEVEVNGKRIPLANHPSAVLSQ